MNYSINNFCERMDISRSLLYKSIREGWGPIITKIGSRSVITEQNAQKWMSQMEERTDA